MRHRWLDLLLGLAALPPLGSTASAAALSFPIPQKSPSLLRVNNPPAMNDEDSRALAPRPQLVPRAVIPERKSLIFDASDTRRGLDDWELEDYVLVATIEGSLYALDRHSGATKWILQGDGPVVRSSESHHFNPKSANTTKNAWTNKDQQPRWIVQPVEGGQLFLFDEEFGLLVWSLLDDADERNCR